MRGPHLERHLVIGAEVDRLHVAPSAKIPEMEAMAVLIAEQVFRDNPVLKLRR